jgi:hypothetical protein
MMNLIERFIDLGVTIFVDEFTVVYGHGFDRKSDLPAMIPLLVIGVADATEVAEFRPFDL